MVRDETKYDRMIGFARALPTVRRRTSEHLRDTKLTRAKVLALVVQLLEKTLIRVGNDEYARENRSFGLTTLKDGHVGVSGARVRFSFRGKSGVEHGIDLTDRRLARIVQACRDIPGYDLFQLRRQGRRHPVGSADVNAYLKAATGRTSKDRTWAGTVLAAGSCATSGAVTRASGEAPGVQAVERSRARQHQGRVPCVTSTRPSRVVSSRAPRSAPGRCSARPPPASAAEARF